MNILITGGNGYVSKSLYNGLKDEHSTVVITRQDFDLSNYESTCAWFSERYFDVVIHAAVEGGSRLKKDDGNTLYRNILMYDNLVDCRNNFGRLITFGSGAEFTMTKTPYGLSKRIIRDSLLTHDEFYNLRIFSVFDENEVETRFVKSNIKRYLNREPMLVYGNKKMDFFYMQDLISLVRHYIEDKDPPKEIDCSYKEKHSLLEVANIINDSLSHKVDIICSPVDEFDYTGQYTQLIEYHGLHYGINRTLFQLHNQLGKTDAI